MSTRHAFWLTLIAALVAGHAEAQQVTTTTRNTRLGNSFFENFGTGFGFNVQGGGLRGDDRGRSSVVGFGPTGILGNNIQFNQPGFGGAQAQFGGGQPGNQTTFGFGITGSNFGANFGFSFGQGNTQTLSSSAPFVTTMNGQPGMFADQVQQPFVIGLTPVINSRWLPPGARRSFGYSPSTLAPAASPNPILDRYSRLKNGEALTPHATSSAPAGAAGPRAAREPVGASDASTADLPALSVAEIKRRQALADEASNQEALDNYERGLKAEREGKTGTAKIFYRMATRDATGRLKELAETRLDQLSKPAPRRSTSDLP